MSILIDDLIVRPALGLMHKEADGQRYIVNPNSYHCLVVLPQAGHELLDFCSVGHSVYEIKQHLTWARGNPWLLADLLNTLAAHGILNLGNRLREFTAFDPRSSKKQTMRLWLQMTDACNLRCRYCYINKNPKHMSIETAKTVVSRVAQECYRAGFDSLEIKCAGGEPTIRWDVIKELVDWLGTSSGKASINISVSILTNGTNLSSDLIDYAADRRVHLSMSLDGSEQWHDKNRPYANGQGSFRDVERSIDTLLQRDIRPGLITTITKHNVKGLTELAEYCVNRGLHFRFSPYRQTVTATEDLKCGNDEMIFELRRCYEWLESHLPIENLGRIHKFSDISFRGPKTRVCGIGDSEAAISIDGKLCLCQFDFDGVIGDALSDSVLTLLKEQKKFVPASKEVDRITGCQNCEWRYICGGGCPMHARNCYGTFYHHSPYCEVYKEIIPVLLRLHAIQLLRSRSAADSPNALRCSCQGRRSAHGGK